MQQSRSKGGKKRIYIGNLPQCDNVRAKLVDFIPQQADGLHIVKEDVTIVRQGAAALVACQDVNRAIAALNNTDFEGNKLLVQRERKKRPNSTKKQPFGGGGWSRPSSTNKPQKERTSTSERQHEVKEYIPASELKAAENDASNGDVVNTMIASTAAMTLLSSADVFGLDQNNTTTVDDSSPEKPPQEGQDTTNDAQNDFLSQSKKPLSELLAGYGEQDLDFKKVVPTKTTESPKKEKNREDYNNRLMLQGKAPIHVEVTSFGYIHGVPSDVRSGGWSHAHPLSPIDCRDLPQVPHYMARQDGLSPAVKRALLNARNVDDVRDNSVRECANELGSQMFDALYEAILVGDHGHVSPLRMTVYVGSESGRHRSVVVCELAATALRKLLRSNTDLRSNKDNRITQPVSVGTRHRDIERRQRRDSERRPKQSKQSEFESEW